MFITESYGRQVVPFLLETVHEEPDEKVLMIGHCFNPQCNEELRYLRQGSVYQWERGVAKNFHSEFFWLCSTCSPLFKVISDHEGDPSLAPAALRDEAGRRKSRIRRVLRDVMVARRVAL
jgi:hypothetical protein